jgi:quinol-cytochrome oxidoreductase complex cytochrome b subunit
MLVMIPLNVLVFGLDNLIFLLYPYRMQQEGLEIFLRTILTFTGKGLLFAVGLAVLSAWGLATGSVTRGMSHWTGSTIDGPAVFAGGIIAGASLSAALVLCALSRTYRNMNPVEDVPR